jgi:type III pantothenate kinase
MILVDIGNSAIKWCRLDASASGLLGAIHRCQRDPLALADALVRDGSGTDAVRIASVADENFNADLGAALKAAQFESIAFLSASDRFGDLVNSYPEPDKMGVDRWMAMVATRSFCSGPAVVIDAGSAITIDIIGESGQHQGGYILPGVAMMERSLLRDTQRVRFDARAPASVFPGTKTSDCVAAGIWAAAFGAVKLVLAEHAQHSVVVTGGDGESLLTLGIDGDWRPNLVLEGIALASRA